MSLFLLAVVFYNETGGQQPFDMRGHEGVSDVREFGCAVSNPSGDAVVIGNFNKFFVFSRDARSGRWEESQATEVDNLYAVTALTWRPDGAKVYLGNMTGLVDAFDAHVKRTKIWGCEFTFVSPSQVRGGLHCTPVELWTFLPLLATGRSPTPAPRLRSSFGTRAQASGWH